jgi:uncharacterized membrane protein
MKKVIFTFVILFTFAQPVFAQSNATGSGAVLQDKIEIEKAQVLEVIKEDQEILPGTDLPTTYQTLQVQVLDGSEKGDIVTFTDDYVTLSKGDTFYLNHTVRAEDGRDLYSISDAYRLGTLYLFTAIFVLLVLLIGGIQGLRGLLSLAGSLILIIYVLLPAILAGYSPVLVSIGVASLIIVLGSYITHGFNKTTSSAVLGMIITVIITGGLAYWSVHMGKLTGYGTEEALYLAEYTRGHVDIVGVLLGGIMIGVLGVLYDVAIGQAISVEELHHIAPHIPRKTIYTRAIRIGREHIGALVNTLAIAYVGASLPLLLLFSQAGGSPLLTLNKEIFATEIIRTLVGSIGLVLAVPITTLIAVYILFKKPKEKIDIEKLEKEKHALEHFEHHH